MSARFASRVFHAAWVWGLVSLVPMYFLEPAIAAASRAPVSPPEYYYGFIGTALAFQAVFFAVAREPARLRPAMPACIAEKLAFAVAALVLVALGRSGTGLVPFALVDLAFATLFTMSLLRTPASGAGAPA